MNVCSADEARKIDTRAMTHYHIPSLILMEHAAQKCAERIKKEGPDKKSVIVCGPGNNGGDGLAIARLLVLDRIRPYVFMMGSHMSESEKVQYDILKAMHVPIHTQVEEALLKITEADIVVDALFGNGLTRNIEGPYADVINHINACKNKVYAVDIASGLDATTGRILGTCIHADATIALDCYKRGHWIGQGLEVSGQIECADIGIPHDDSISPFQMIDEDLAKACLPIRKNHSHKGTFGKALMIGGCQSMHGAITMAAQACYHSGIGTLTLMIPDCIGDIIAYKMDSVMRQIVKSENGYFSNDILQKDISRYDIITIGNGLGRTEITKEIVKKVLKTDAPVILDADAIWGIQEQSELLNRSNETILTPHIKELSYILQRKTSDIANNPIEAALEFSKRFPNCTLILKSSITIIVKGNRRLIWAHPNSALAKGGSGDILCGIVTGLFGQNKDACKAAICAAYIHGKSADTKKDPAAFQPDDCIENINRIFVQLRKT